MAKTEGKNPLNLSLLMLDGPDDVAWTATELIANRLRARPESRCAFPTGATPRLTVLCDRSAREGDSGSKKQSQTSQISNQVLLVLGNSLSSVQQQRLDLAANIARKHPSRAIIFSGYSKVSGQTSEAVLMAAAWPGPLMPMLLDEAAQSTADNVARSLPIIRALSGIKQVTVVTSAFHFFRACYLFRPYRSYGLKVKIRFCGFGANSLQSIINEIKCFWKIRRTRQEAYSASCLNVLRPLSRSLSKSKEIADEE